MADRRTEAARWYRQASFDLKAARWNREGGFHDTACFLAQQAAGKALESLFYGPDLSAQAIEAADRIVGAVASW